MGQSEDGKKIKVSLGGCRMDSNPNSVVFFFLPRFLRAAAAAFDAPNMYMDLYTEKKYLIVTEYEDEEDEGSHARTLISMLPNPNRVNLRVRDERGHLRDSPVRVPRGWRRGRFIE